MVSVHGISPFCVHRETSVTLQTSNSIVKRSCHEGYLWTWWYCVHLGLCVFQLSRLRNVLALLFRQRFILSWDCCNLILLSHVLNRVAVLLHVVAKLLVGVQSIDAS